MKTNRYVVVSLLAVALLSSATSAQTRRKAAADTATTKAVAKATAIEKATVAIEKMIKAYEKAFNARDAKTLASYWSPEGVYTSRVSGEQIVGRKNLEADFTDLFKQEKNTRLALATESIEFVSPNVAVEKGVATVLRPKAEADKTTYTVVYIKTSGKWLIDRVNERGVTVVKSHYDKLKDLEWMVGDWVDKDEAGSVIKTTCKWTRNRNFLTRTFTASLDDRVDITGMQFVGWDAARKEIRSWVFDSDGGFAEGTWKKVGNNWIVKTSATLPDGKKGASTTILRLINGDTIGWQKTGRTLNGELLPNLDEVVIIREGT